MVFGYNIKIFTKYGVSVPINVPVTSHPHALITGASGSGKSMTLLFLLGKLLQENPEIVVYFCDFKNSEEFAFLEGYSRYYAGEDCYDGLMDYYEAFSKVRADRTLHNRRRYLLIFDEYPAFVNYLTGRDKLNKTKLSNDVLGAVSEILMLGRGISFGLWVATQRADASLFANGARDNFMVVVGLGRLSKEQKGMIFSGQDIPDMAYGAGEGVLLADGRELVAVKYPLIEDLADWKRHIVEILGSCPIPPL